MHRKHGQYSKQIVPFLWYLTASNTESPAVRKKALAVLSDTSGSFGESAAGGRRPLHVR